MNYLKHYENLINTRKTRYIDQHTYYEKHHIIMQCHGGTNDKENLVLLTAREHFLAHWLLWRIHRDAKSAHAFFNMCRISNNQERRITSSIAYQEAKESMAITVSGRFKNIPKSEMHKSRISESNKNKRKSESHRSNLSASLNGKSLEYKFGKEISDKMKENLSEKFSGSNNPNSRPIIRVYEDGNEKEYFGIWDVIKTEGLSRHKLRKALRQNIEYEKCQWKYKH